MSLSLRFFYCAILICGFALPAQAESIDDQVNSYCEVVRKPGKKAEAAFSSIILRSAKIQNIQLTPAQVDRHHMLETLMSMISISMPSNNINRLDKLDSNQRVKLCRALEKQRLALIELSSEWASKELICESASQPTQQPNEMLVSQNAELASKMKLTIKPEIANRYPALINHLLTAQSSKSCGSTQKELDELDELGPEKRAKLCLIMEKERLQLKQLDINYAASMVIVDVTERK